MKRVLPKITALSSGEINENEYLAGQETLYTQQHGLLNVSKRSQFSKGKTFKNEVKKKETLEMKHVESMQSLDLAIKQLEDIFPENQLNKLSIGY